MKTITLDGTKYVAEKDYNELVKKKTTKVIVGGKEIPFVVGGKYFFRTVTYFATGEVESVNGNFLTLKDAAWIADTGRFRDAIMSGILIEVEPVEVPMFININSITDAFAWTHALPRDQK